jgi:hypothetical protein
MAIVAEGERADLPIADRGDGGRRTPRKPQWKPAGALIEDARAFTPILRGLAE